MLNKGTTGTIFVTSRSLGLEPVPLALEASTLPLGYQGGCYNNKNNNNNIIVIIINIAVVVIVCDTLTIIISECYYL